MLVNADGPTSKDGPAIDQRQGVFVSGGTISGPVVGVNYGTVNYYSMEIGPAGTKLNDGSVAQITVLETVTIVPRTSRTFYDRENTLLSLHEEFRPGGGAWLSGARGCGLSTLLRKAANLPSATALPNGAIYLDGIQEPADLDEILRRLYTYYHASSAPIAISPQAARAFLSQRRGLFVLDRLPLDHDALVGLADTLSQGAVLIGGEGTAPETLADLPLRGLPGPDALQLVAGTAQVDRTQPDIAPLLDRLCAALDHLPLPLVLAGRLIRAKVAPLAQMLAVLDDMGASGTRSQEPLAMAAQLALKALTDDERAILAVLTRTHSLTSEAITAISQRTPAAVEPSLRRLIDLGLVAAGNERYQIASASLRRVLDVLLPPGEEKKRAAAFFAAAAIGMPAINLEWLLHEQRNILDAIATLLEGGEPTQAGALAQAMQPALVLDGQWSTWHQVIDLAARAAQATGDQALRAWALHERGTYAGVVGDGTTAAADLGAARRLRLDMGDTSAADVTLHNMRYLNLLPPAAPPTEPNAGAGMRLNSPILLVACMLVVAGLLILGYLFWPARPSPITDQPTSMPPTSAAVQPTAVVAPTVQPSAVVAATSVAVATQPELITQPTAAPTSVPTIAPTSVPTPVPATVTPNPNQLPAGSILYLDVDGASIKSMRPDGNGQETIFKIRKPDNEIVTYLASDATGRYILYALSAGGFFGDGTYYLLKNDTVQELGEMYNVRWSPDRTRFAGRRFAGDGGDSSFIYDPAKDQQALQVLPFSGFMDWLPDETGLLYLMYTESIAQIYRYDIATNRSTRLTTLGQSGISALNMLVLPDGKHLLVYGPTERTIGASGQGNQWWSMEIDGGQPQAYSAPWGSLLADYALSSGGSLIAYAEQTHLSFCDYPGSLTVAAANSDPGTPITVLPAGDAGAPPNLQLISRWPASEDLVHFREPVTWGQFRGLSWVSDRFLAIAFEPYSCSGEPPDPRRTQTPGVYLLKLGAGRPGQAEIHKLADGSNPIWIEER